MSKHKSLHIKITVFAFGEAETEGTFLKHIRAIYGRNTGVKVKIDNANGGGSGEIVDSAIRNSSNIPFNRRFILLDTDVPWTQEAKNKARSNTIELIPATPCIEGFLLSILEPRGNFTNRLSRDCKRLFERKYLHENDKLDYRNYKSILPKNKLEVTRSTNQILDRIISLMTKITM